MAIPSAHLGRRVLAARERLAVLALEQGEAAEAERHLRLAVAVDPLRESTQRALMQVLAVGGNYAAALLCYRELRLRLHRELNAEPDPETQTLFQQLRREARRLSAKGPTAPARGDRPGPPPRSERPLLLGRPARAAELPAAVLRDALTRGRMVGREAERTELEHRIEAARGGEGAAVLLAGEPGIGKTRLATEACALARRRGFRVLIGRCDEKGAAPFQPFAEALREYLDRASPEQAEETLPPPVACELVRLAPRIAEKVKDVPPVAVAAGAAARQGLIEAMGEFFALLSARQGPVLLFLDDLHWADEGSLAMLRALARGARTRRLLIVGTYRDLPPDLQHPLEETLVALHRERATERLPLRRLPEAGVAELVSALLDQASPPAAFVAALYCETEGSPFFIEELLKHLVEEGAIFREDGRWQIRPLQDISVPQSIKVTIGRRLQRLGEESREALRLAAVIGQQFRFDLLLQASELEEERLLAMVEEWLGAHLVVEERQGREELYRFQHALIREVLYGEVSLRRKARLHERVGEALEAVAAGSLEGRVGELAHHFAQARSGAAMEKGVVYCLRAGEQSRHVYATSAAIQHLTAALELLEGLPEDEGRLRQRWEVISNLTKAYSDCRAFERAEDVLQGYLALAQRAGYPWGVAAAHYWMAAVLQGSHWAAGIADSEISRRLLVEHLEKSLQIAEAHGLADWQARARLDLARGARHLAVGLPRSEGLLRQTLQAPEGVPSEVVQETYTELMWICALQGKWDAVAAALRQSIHLGRPGSLPYCLEVMEQALNRAGKQGEFVAFCEEAKAVYAQAGLPLPLHQWYLEPATPCEEFRQLLFRDDFEGPELGPEWQWQDPAQVSRYSLSDRPGYLTLRPGPGVDLWPLSNLNAPRMLLEVRGDFALETKMAGDWVGRSLGIDGLLVWKDVLNYVRFEKCGLGRVHRGGIHLWARVAGAHELFGRGELWGDSYYLRLERSGDRFAALCSTDGIHWLTCGQVVLPVKDPLRVGVAASYGMVVHFDYVQLLGRG